MEWINGISMQFDGVRWFECGHGMKQTCITRHNRPKFELQIIKIERTTIILPSRLTTLYTFFLTQTIYRHNYLEITPQSNHQSSFSWVKASTVSTNLHMTSAIRHYHFFHSNPNCRNVLLLASIMLASMKQNIYDSDQNEQTCNTSGLTLQRFWTPSINFLIHTILKMPKCINVTITLPFTAL